MAAVTTRLTNETGCAREAQRQLRVRRLCAVRRHIHALRRYYVSRDYPSRSAAGGGRGGEASRRMLQWLTLPAASLQEKRTRSVLNSGLTCRHAHVGNGQTAGMTAGFCTSCNGT